MKNFILTEKWGNEAGSSSATFSPRSQMQWTRSLFQPRHPSSRQSTVSTASIVCWWRWWIVVTFLLVGLFAFCDGCALRQRHPPSSQSLSVKMICNQRRTQFFYVINIYFLNSIILTRFSPDFYRDATVTRAWRYRDASVTISVYYSN